MHPVQNRFGFLLALALSAGTPLSLSSQSLKIYNIRAWDSEKREFLPPRDMTVKNGKWESWENPSEKTKEPIKYILPTFCDAGVTLGSNSWDGKLGLKDINSHLMSFTALGFSHLLSVGDGKGIDRLSDEILKGQRIGPILVSAEKVSLGHSGEDPTPNQEGSHRFEFLLNEEADCPKSLTKQKIHPFFLKKKEGDGFSQRQLNSCLENIRERGGRSLAFTFGEKELWDEGLYSGFKVFYQSLPKDWDEEDIRFRDLWWSPQLTVSRMSALRNNPEKIKTEIRFWASVNPQFKLIWLDKNIESIPIPEQGQESGERDWKKTLASLRKGTRARLLFSSGSGFFGVLPGISPLQEIYLWDKFLFEPRRKETVEEEQEQGFRFAFWNPPPRPFYLKEPKLDRTKVPEKRILILEALTQNACEFLGAEHRGRIELGEVAFFSMYSKNPLESPLGIFEIESVVQRGKLVYTQEREKKGKQK